MKNESSSRTITLYGTSGVIARRPLVTVPSVILLGDFHGSLVDRRRHLFLADAAAFTRCYVFSSKTHVIRDENCFLLLLLPLLSCILRQKTCSAKSLIGSTNTVLETGSGSRI